MRMSLSLCILRVKRTNLAVSYCNFHSFKCPLNTHTTPSSIELGLQYLLYAFLKTDLSFQFLTFTISSSRAWTFLVGIVLGLSSNGSLGCLFPTGSLIFRLRTSNVSVSNGVITWPLYNRSDSTLSAHSEPPQEADLSRPEQLALIQVETISSPTTIRLPLKLTTASSFVLGILPEARLIIFCLSPTPLQSD